MIKPATMEFVSLSNGETIAYQEVGRRNTDILVLIHGNMTSSQHWDLVIEKLQDQYHIYALDLRGFGQSTYNQSIDSLQDFADDVKLFIDELKLEIFINGLVNGWWRCDAIYSESPNFCRKVNFSRISRNERIPNL